MAKLSELFPIPRKIPTGNGNIEVRGLSMGQVTQIISEHKTELAMAFVGSSPDPAVLIAQSPKVALEIFCMGTDSVGQEDDAAKFPLQFQIEVLLAIWEETVPDLKKLSELLSRVMGQLRDASSKLAVANSTSKTPSLTESPASSDKDIDLQNSASAP